MSAHWTRRRERGDRVFRPAPVTRASLSGAATYAPVAEAIRAEGPSVYERAVLWRAALPSDRVSSGLCERLARLILSRPQISAVAQTAIEAADRRGQSAITGAAIQEALRPLYAALGRPMSGAEQWIFTDFPPERF